LWTTEPVGGRIIPGQVLTGHVPGNHYVLARPTLALGKPTVAFERPTAANDHQARVGLALEHRRPGAQQEPQPLTFLEPTDEQHRWTLRGQCRGFAAFVETGEIDP